MITSGYRYDTDCFIVHTSEYFNQTGKYQREQVLADLDEPCLYMFYIRFRMRSLYLEMAG